MRASGIPNAAARFARRAGETHQALSPSCERGLTSVAGALLAMMFGLSIGRAGLGILISVKILVMAELGGAGMRRAAGTETAILVAAGGIFQACSAGKGAGWTLVATVDSSC